MTREQRIIGAVLAVLLLPGCMVFPRPYGMYRVWVDKNLHRRFSLQCESIERLPLDSSRVRLAASDYNTGAPPGFDWTRFRECDQTSALSADPQNNTPAGGSVSEPIPTLVPTPVPGLAPSLSVPTDHGLPGDGSRIEGPTALRPISAEQVVIVPSPPVKPRDAISTGGWLFTR